MAIGGLIGGYAGGTISHRANRTVVRSTVVAIGFAASAYLLLEIVRPGRDPGRRRIDGRADVEDKAQLMARVARARIQRVLKPRSRPRTLRRRVANFGRSHCRGQSSPCARAALDSSRASESRA